VHDAPTAPVHARELSRTGKVLLLLLVAYSVAVILPDTLRLTALYQAAYYLAGLREAVTGERPSGSHPAALGWYPLGNLGFTADNNGTVTSVDDCGGTRPCDLPAWGKLQVGDRIDLGRTAMSDRRAVNQMVFVAHDRPVTLQVAAKANGAPAGEITLMPSSEVLRFFGASSLDAWTLLLDQLGGLFFIGLAALCVRRHPTRMAWGLLLYAVWYNSGQYFVWYANLSVAALRWFDWLQAIFSGAGLTGLLVFALHFPRDSVQAWRRRLEPWLFLPFAALTILSVWSFRNFTAGVQTERVYDLYYYLTFAVYLAVFATFVDTYVTQPSDRPRIRWVIVGALSGLLCFLFADVYEATSMLNWLPFSIPEWVLQTLYAVNVVFPLSVVYAIRRHRVINVRLVLNRSFVVLTSLVLATLALAAFDLVFHEQIGRSAPWIAGVAAIVAGMVHERLRGVEDVVDWLFFRRWYVAEHDLKKVAERLAQAQAAQVGDVNRALIDIPADELNLASAGLFERQPDLSFRRVHATPSWPATFLPAIPNNHPLIALLKDVPLALPDRYWEGLAAPLYQAQMPVLAVPVAIRGTLSRIALFGAHTNDETFDRDELNIIRKLAQSAAFAYTALDAEALRVENRKLEEQLRAAQASMLTRRDDRTATNDTAPATDGQPDG